MAMMIGAATPLWAEDLEAGLKRGDELLKTLAPLPATYANTIYLEADFAGTTVGVEELALEARREAGQVRYHYRYRQSIGVPDGRTMLVKVEAMADANFAPLEIRWETTTVKPNGQQVSARGLTRVTAGKVTVHEEDEEQGTSSEKELARPEGPFVIAASFLLQRVQPPDDEPFVLRVFRPAEGTVVRQVFKTNWQPDGTIQVDVQNEGEGPVGYYRLDKDRQLLGFQEPGVFMAMKRSTKEKVEQYEQEWRRPKPLPTQPTSGPASRPAASQPKQRRDKK